MEEEKERFQKAAYAVLGMLNKNCKLTRLVLLPFMFLVELGIQSVAIVFHSFEDTVSVKYIKAQTHQQSQNMYLNTGACISLPVIYYTSQTFNVFLQNSLKMSCTCRLMMECWFSVLRFKNEQSIILS